MDWKNDVLYFEISDFGELGTWVFRGTGCKPIQRQSDILSLLNPTQVLQIIFLDGSTTDTATCTVYQKIIISRRGKETIRINMAYGMPLTLVVISDE